MGASQKDIDPSGDTRIQKGVTCSPSHGPILPITPSTARLTTGDFQLRQQAGRPRRLLVFSAPFLPLPPPLPSSESFPLSVADTSQEPRFHHRTVGFHHNCDGLLDHGKCRGYRQPPALGEIQTNQLA